MILQLKYTMLHSKRYAIVSQSIKHLYATKKSESEHNTEIRKQNYKSIF
jgi:hypothetical protein